MRKRTMLLMYRFSFFEKRRDSTFIGGKFTMNNGNEFRIVITPFCNYRCFFCHSEGLVKECTPMLLSPKDYTFAVRAAKHLWGWDTVTITGGEPLVSPIYGEVCSLIADEGVKITTVTNASLIASPKKILDKNSQLNISLHTLDKDKYRKMTRSSYPLSQVIDTIIAVRSQLPELLIHLNSTVIRGINDSPEEMMRIINFADRINGVAKFIDLAHKNNELVVPFEEIDDKLWSLGFKMMVETPWQTLYEKDDKQVMVTRCGFSERAANTGYRSLFLNPDGVIMSDNQDGLSINLLKEIHEQDLEGFAKKVEWYFPPVRKV